MIDNKKVDTIRSEALVVYDMWLQRIEKEYLTDATRGVYRNTMKSGIFSDVLRDTFLSGYYSGFGSRMFDISK